jgi:hypothetical protein
MTLAENVFMKSICFIIGVLMTSTAFAEWTPPEKPDPQVILNEAQSDASSRRYEDALAKHRWFHEHALTYMPSMYGVRLSFALESWVELGDAYPPALRELERIREETGQEVLECKVRKVGALFYDFQSINRALEEESRTTELFHQLDQKHPDKAEAVYDAAMPALLKSKEYKLCGKYLNPKKMIKRDAETFHMHQKLAKDPRFSNSELDDFGQKRFTNSASILVALLVVNDRRPEAVEVMELAKKEWADPEFQSALDKALTGEVPKPWP